MAIQISNLQKKVQIPREIRGLIRDAIKISLSNEKFNMPYQLNILLVDNDRIKDINSEFRKVDKPTDVLSFPMVDMIDGEIMSTEGDFDMDKQSLMLGDIVISMEQAIIQAQEFNHSLERELAFLVTHGVFHIMGYDHIDQRKEKDMIMRQEAVLEKMGITRGDQ